MPYLRRCFNSTSFSATAIKIWIAFIFLYSIPILATGQASSGNPESILIRNVRLVDRGDKTKDVIVNLLIENALLKLVTRDKISSDEVDLAFDAQGSVVLGKLHLGEPVSLLILDQDPRENFETLLNTEKHLLLAMRKGKIVMNLLPQLPTEGEVPKESRGWLAYSPPPMALPVSYGDETQWNRWEGSWFSGIFIAAVMLDRMWWLDQDETSRQQVGDLSSFSEGEIRALRFGIGGTINFKQPWIYTLIAATSAFDKGFDTNNDNNITLYDVRLDIPLPSGITMSLGKQKAPISMERLTPLMFLPMQERSIAADAMLAARDVGILLNGTIFNKRMTWAGGVFNDWFVKGTNFNESNSQFVGRLTTVFLGASDESNLLHIGLGTRYTNIKQGIRYRSEPEFNMSPLFVDTDILDAKNEVTWVGELSWRRGPLWIEGEYVASSLESSSLNNPNFWGYHITASYTITGEMRSYNRKNGQFKQVPVARSVDHGGQGAWEVSVRWSELDQNDKAVNGGRVGIASVGFTWWLSPLSNISLNYRHILLDHSGLSGQSDGLNARVFLSLE